MTSTSSTTRFSTARSMTSAGSPRSWSKLSSSSQAIDKAKGQNHVSQKPMTAIDQNRALQKAADRLSKNGSALDRMNLSSQARQLAKNNVPSSELERLMGSNPAQLHPKQPAIPQIGPSSGPYWYMMN